MREFESIVGRRFGRLVAVQYDRATHNWVCRCDCGRTSTSRITALREGKRISCGCARRERASRLNRTHGMTRSPEYLTWRAMKQRCLNPRAAQFAWYGGRGISICRRWAESFEAFLADVGPRPAGTTLDRHPNRDGNYEPGNVRWATSAEQALNQSQTITLQLDGISDTTDGWAKRTGLSARLIRLRLFRGWSVERTLTAPKSFRGTR